MVYTLQTKQKLPISLAEAWDFFSTPKNLQKITPEYLGFKILSKPDFLEKAYAGQIIHYKVHPLLGIPLHWVTEIKHVEDQSFFVDEQRFGPYAFWHHQHHFKAVEGGVEMVDLIHYKLPLGILGRLANFIFVRRQLEGIFTFRTQRLVELFG